MNARWADLRTRTLSALIFGIGVLFTTWWNEISFDLLLLCAGVVLLREWIDLTRERHGIWVPIGMLYIAASLIALAYLRHAGYAYIYLLLALVWAGDIGAYFVGKQFGRHKIIPSISPGKTWEGLLGAVFFTSLTMAACSFFALSHQALLSPPITMLAATVHLLGIDIQHLQVMTPHSNHAFFAVLVFFSALVELLGLGGDLFESWLKRRAGVKDSGTLLPGHGGLFDRLDALLPNALFFALMLLWMDTIKTWP